MKRRWFVWGCLSLVVLLLTIAHPSGSSWLPLVPVQAQSPAPASPSAPPTAPTPFPPVPVPVTPATPAAPPAPPASTAPPAELDGTYVDPAGRFKVGVLKEFKVNPLSGSVLIEAPDGNLAYTVVPQSQPVGNPIGLVSGYDNSESLAKIATTVFQRGEAFQPAPARLEAGGGAVMDWTGALTIGGSSQPMRGVILVRPTTQNILLLLIAATQAGEAQVSNALSALATSLEPLQ